ncbi:MAG: pyridoxamine kinase [Clostridiales bacterium]|jgi:pyridoxine kinase|nr:pyridoxamine kinase [Clostridiales bacterium]
MGNQKRAAAIHDISCFGRCSLTVALPIISAAGVECSVIPTAVFSTHTGGFDGFIYRDLADFILPVVRHWRDLGLEFDAIYTGFLGSFEQIDIIKEVIALLRAEDTRVIVDPVMADYGKLYSIFPDNFPDGMRGLCEIADVITPNLTEAAFLLGQPYRDGIAEPAEIERALRSLRSLGAKNVVLTGVAYDDKTLGAASIDESGRIETSFAERIDRMYHGTGDVFASVVTAALLAGKTLAEAADAAVRFTVAAIRGTRESGVESKYGVEFERFLKDLPGIIG